MDADAPHRARSLAEMGELQRSNGDREHELVSESIDVCRHADLEVALRARIKAKPVA